MAKVYCIFIMSSVIQLNINKGNDSEIKKIHYIPCKIYKDGEAKVSKYFSPLITTDENGSHEASLRGYPLKGKTVQLPDGYEGLIFQRSSKSSDENNESSNLYKTHSFKQLTFWNWDKEPSPNDALLAALEWIDVAEVLIPYCRCLTVSAWECFVLSLRSWDNTDPLLAVSLCSDYRCYLAMRLLSQLHSPAEAS